MNAERPNEPLLPFNLFDDKADVAVVERKLPHWSQSGTVAFITWRTLDSMPAAVVILHLSSFIKLHEGRPLRDTRKWR